MSTIDHAGDNERDEDHERRVDVDRETIRRILALPIDDELVDDLDAAEAPVDDPWSDE